MNKISWKDILKKDALFARYDIITGERNFTKDKFLEDSRNAPS